MSDQIKEIKDRLSVSDVVGDYVKLQQKGNSLKACCPFHNEKTPSFQVSDDKGIWHCFGCGKGGDIFTFVEEIESVEFKEALKILAEKAGIELKRFDKEKIKQEKSAKTLLELTALFFEKALEKSESGKIAREYIQKRDIPVELVSRFRIGYSPDSYDILSSFLLKKGYKPQHLAQYGLVVKKPDGSSYDRFRNRLMFPIADQNGNVVGFGARELEGDRGPKYLNSPETPIYHKSNILYGYHLAKREARKKDQMIVVEGYMDVIASHKAEIQNIVASSGTALTIEQVRLIKRITQNVYLAFDMDNAGAEATRRGVKIALTEQMNIKIVEIPNGKDPDEAIKEDPEIWKIALKNAKPVMDYFFNKALEKNAVDNLEGKKALFKELTEWIACIIDPIEKDHYIKELSGLLGVASEIIIKEVQEIASNKATQPQAKPQIQNNTTSQIKKNKKTSEENVASEVLVTICAHPVMATTKTLEKIEKYLSGKEKQLAKDIMSVYTTHTITHGREVFDILESNFNNSFVESQILTMKYEAAKIEGSPNSKPEEQIKALLARLIEREKKNELARLSFEMKQAEKIGDTEKIAQLLKKVAQLSKKS